ncbi:MAG: gamma-glutamyltransferase, partial [Pseudomonadota bacterium]|nr:gamma-glutamyltransferase [Pseudomonadota bacterium]
MPVASCFRHGVVGVVAVLVLSSAAHAADRVTGKPFATRSEIYAPHAMAATSHPLATQIALDV